MHPYNMTSELTGSELVAEGIAEYLKTHLNQDFVNTARIYQRNDHGVIEVLIRKDKKIFEFQIRPSNPDIIDLYFMEHYEGSDTLRLSDPDFFDKLIAYIKQKAPSLLLWSRGLAL